MKENRTLIFIVLVATFVFGAGFFGGNSTFVETFTSAEHTTKVGADIDTWAEKKLQMPISQSATVGTATSTVLTPTAGYGVVYIDLQCTDAITTFTMSETGAITNALFYVRNVSSGANEGHVCRIDYTASNFEHEGGAAGKYLTLNDNGRDSFIAVKLSDRYAVINNNTSSKYASGFGTKTPISGDADTFATAFASIDGDTSNMYGGVFRTTAVGTAALPDATINMNFTITDAGDTPTIEPLAAGTDDTIYLNETSCGQGKYIISDGTTGNLAYFQYMAPDTWWVIADGFTCEE